MLVLCVAFQSDITQPLKPNRPFKSRERESWFSHAHLPICPFGQSMQILLYEHMTEPKPASIAP